MRKKDFEDEPDEREIKANITKKARRIKKECFFQAAIQSIMLLWHNRLSQNAATEDQKINVFSSISSTEECSILKRCINEI